MGLLTRLSHRAFINNANIQQWRSATYQISPLTTRNQIMTRGFSSSSSSGDGKASGVFSSWLGKIKGVFKPVDTAQELPSSAEATPPQKPAAFTLLTFADELKKARRLESFTKIVKLQPGLTDATMAKRMDNHVAVLRSLAKYDLMGQNLNTKNKADTAAECGCTISEVDEVLRTYEHMRVAQTKLMQMKEKGEELPKSLDEVKKLLVDSSPRKTLVQSTTKAEVGRNAPCTCGSGKKYKRCCGKGI